MCWHNQRVFDKLLNKTIENKTKTFFGKSPNHFKNPLIKTQITYFPDLKSQTRTQPSCDADASICDFHEYNERIWSSSNVKHFEFQYNK